MVRLASRASAPASVRLPRAEEDGAEDDSNEELLEKQVSRIGQRVYFYTGVSRTSIRILIRKLHEAAAEALAAAATTPQVAPRVTLFINSEGGCARSGLSAMDHIQALPVPVVTVADGMCASAATFLLLGGKQRQIMEHSEVLIHQLSTGFWGTYTSLLDEVTKAGG